MREYTTQQRELVQYLTRVFGKDYIKAGNPDGYGWVLVRAKCQLGEWHWRFDSDGELKSAHIAERLFDMAPQPKRKPANAQAN